MEKRKGQVLFGLHAAVVGDLFHDHVALFHPLDPGRGQPLDVLVAHLRFQKPLGVAHPVKAEVADIGLRV